MIMAFIQLNGLDGKIWVAAHEIQRILPSTYPPFSERGAQATICFRSGQPDDCVPVIDTPDEVMVQVAKAIDPPPSPSTAMVRRIFEGG